MTLTKRWKDVVAAISVVEQRQGEPLAELWRGSKFALEVGVPYIARRPGDRDPLTPQRCGNSTCPMSSGHWQ